MEMVPFPKVENTKGWPIWGSDDRSFFFDLLFDLPLNLKNGVDNEVVGKLNYLGQSLERPRAFNCW